MLPKQFSLFFFRIFWAFIYTDISTNYSEELAIRLIYIHGSHYHYSSCRMATILTIQNTIFQLTVKKAFRGLPPQQQKTHISSCNTQLRLMSFVRNTLVHAMW